MILQTFPSGPFLTNCYVIGCAATKAAAVIDPAPESLEKVSAFIAQSQLKLNKIILTHSHWDHIADVAACKKKYNAPIFIHKLDKGNVEIPGSDGLPCWIAIEGTPVDHFLNEGDTIHIGLVPFTVIHTPGHTPGGICLYCAEHKTLISGDTLFKGSIGNLSFQTADPMAMWPSLDKLAQLPKDTKVYPGHGPNTTLEAESWLANARRIFGG